VEDRFTFVPAPKEALAALQLLNRSIIRQTNGGTLRSLLCLAIYAVPLIVAAVFFSKAFDQILATFFVFTVAAMILRRLFPGGPSIAERYCIDTDVRFADDGIRQVTPWTETSWPWSSLSRLHVVDKLIVLEFRDWSWAILPDRLWPDESGKARFLEDVRSCAPQAQSGLSGEVATPFSPINVGAGFGGVGIFLLLLVVLDRVARVGCGCSATWRLFGEAVPFPVLYGTVCMIALATFFPIRYALRWLDRRQHHAATAIAYLLMLAAPVAFAVITITQ
jgi:hypothetical protein